MMFMPALQHLQDITESVWVQFLGVALVPAAAESGPVQAECASTISIRGAWSGQVVVACSHGLARRAAAAMFHRAADSLSEPQVCDALKEVANIIGGNIKALLPDPSHLQLPEYHDNWRTDAVASRISYAAPEGRLHVLLIA